MRAMASDLAPAAHRSSRPARRGTPLAPVRQLDLELRQVVLRVRAWGLRSGRGCATDALTVVAGCALDAGRVGRISPKVWTEARVDALLGGDGRAWCAAHGVDPPPGLGEAIVLWLDFLYAHQALAPGSDRPEVLRTAANRKRSRRAALAAGRRRHPAGRGTAS